MSANLTANERSQRARIAAYAMHARHDGHTVTAAARRNGPGNLGYWLAKINPDGDLSEREAYKRAESAKAEYYQRLSYRGAQARKRKAAHRRDTAQRVAAEAVARGKARAAEYAHEAAEVAE